MKIKIFNPKEDMQGNDRKNVYIVMDESGQYIGNGFVYKKITTTMTPEHPVNIFIEINLQPHYLNHRIGIELFKVLEKRAETLFEESVYQKGLLYYGTTELNDKVTFFIEQGFTESMNTYRMAKSVELTKFSDISYEVKECDHDYIKIIHLHNNVLIKHIDETIIHNLSHKDHYKCFTVYDKEFLVGSIMIYTENTNGIIDHLIVHPDYHKQGIENYLIKKALNYLHQSFIKQVSAEVWSANKEDVLFYQAQGFEQTDVTEFYIGKYMSKLRHS